MERGILDDLAVFTAVARVRSFSRAAPSLGLSVPALSHAIKRLEKRLNVRLLQRNSRSVSPTAAGTRLLDALTPAFNNVEQALLELDRDKDSVTGVVRLTVSRQGYEAIIRPVLAQFAELHPKAQIEVLIEYGFRDIVASGLDAGIRMGYKVERDMIGLPVGPDLRMVVVASPNYLKGRSIPKRIDDLQQHRCIRYRMRAEGSVVPWEFYREGRIVAVDVSGPLTVNEPDLAVEAALDGLGLAYVLEGRAASHIAAGNLVRLMDPLLKPFTGFYLYYSSRRQMHPTLAAFVDVLRKHNNRSGLTGRQR